MEKKIKLLLGPNIQMHQVFRALGVVNPSVRHLNGKAFSGSLYHKDKTINFNFLVSTLNERCVYFFASRCEPNPTKSQDDCPLGYIRTDTLDIILGRNNQNTLCYHNQRKETEFSI